ncbi:MAG: DUF192 domain-containing protein [Bacteriovoracaceae bacterium]|nr:DUF192 domain-containing protein [Bacteriovoracaceae bacterium]
MRYKVQFRGSEIAQNVKIADKFMTRFIGLMFKKKMEGYDGLIIKTCNSVHTCFMYYKIDVIFLDSEFKIIKVLTNMSPWRMTLPYFGATQVLELPGGQFPPDATKGEKLEVVCIN